MLAVCWWALAIANVATFVLYGIDKLQARRGAWRIRERTLLWWTWLGCIGAWCAMGLFRHKTRKGGFRLWAVLGTLLSPLWLCVWWVSRSM